MFDCFRAGRICWLGALAVSLSRAQIWKDLRGQQRIWDGPNKESGAWHLSVPYTLVYLLEEYRDSIIRSEAAEALRVHVIGATYDFEAASYLQPLAQFAKEKIEVVFVLGNQPHFNDGKREGSLTDSTVCGGSANDLHSGDRTADSELLHVTCLHGVYQDVVSRHDLQLPHVALLIGPGFPEVARRSWDAALQHLLAKSIFTVVGSDALNLDLDALSGDKRKFGQPYNATALAALTSLSSHEASDAPRHEQALAAYGVRTVGITINPFPIVWAEGSQLFAKNYYLHAFRGAALADDCGPSTAGEEDGEAAAAQCPAMGGHAVSNANRAWALALRPTDLPRGYRLPHHVICLDGLQIFHMSDAYQKAEGNVYVQHGLLEIINMVHDFQDVASAVARLHAHDWSMWTDDVLTLLQHGALDLKEFCFDLL